MGPYKALITPVLIYTEYKKLYISDFNENIRNKIS